MLKQSTRFELITKAKLVQFAAFVQFAACTNRPFNIINHFALPPQAWRVDISAPGAHMDKKCIS